MRFKGPLIRVAAATAAMLIVSAAAYAQQEDDLREAAQNPIADLISVPFQNNSNFDIGRIFEIGHQPINTNIAAYYNVIRPEDTGAAWQLRAEFTFLFPTH